MAKMKKKGTSGAAKNYVTRNQALKKLQITLADFRRLCILKGIFPRQPRNTKKANKGSSAPASFYYAKDIAFLQHEPVLRALREHKTFAKKLSKAIGRREWAAAKNLDDAKPVYRLDHIIKERYPTFTDSLRDIDDALSLLTLFANLPANDKISSTLISNCARLCAEWQLYVMRTRSLKKVFLSIKGVYFQAEVRGQTISWLVPYMFTQHVPTDVDFRIMMTFLELYQTLLGFVLFKLYTDENLVYPPKFDEEKDNAGAGVGAITLSAANAAVLKGENTGEQGSSSTTVVGKGGKKISAKDVKKQIKAIARAGVEAQEDDDDVSMEISTPGVENAGMEEEFVEHASKTATDQEASGSGLTTLAELQAASGSDEGGANLFAPYAFYISRECPRPFLEFILRSFGVQQGKLGWDMVSGAGSAFDENDERITHHIVDRPPAAAGSRNHPGKRVYVQPQWIVDCVNAKKLLPTEPYGPGKVLPPHLSPFVNDEEVARRGGYVPAEAKAKLGIAEEEASEDDESDSDEEAEDEEEEEEEEEKEEEEKEESSLKKGKSKQSASRPALEALLADPKDSNGAGLLDAAELEAEAAGGEDALADVRAKHAAALKAFKKSSQGKAANKSSKGKSEEEEAKEMANMMMSNRTRKLYNKLNYSAGKRGEEKARLEQKKKALDKAVRKGAPRAAKK
ncbi:hypothetical protein IE53DRAFT_381722 [Violaceomyces palustris]|uniref:Uncharacterized protein n=1 Tax=Violaceomyces palustris TaxID=1673888 RepID=A0ACD0NQ61_9BASI|nr:hypothetical protein IE53DRAFT_381722 [Violaceomyces palustris]